ncbi:MAG: S16 family serine protease [Actinomycetota bacterium]
MSFVGQDVFVAAAGGLTVREPAADLALCLSLHSAKTGRAIADDVVAVGEVGLGGEVRRVPGIERRLAEAARLGFRRAVVPSSTRRGRAELDLIEVGDLTEALGRVYASRPQLVRAAPAHEALLP